MASLFLILPLLVVSGTVILIAIGSIAVLMEGRSIHRAGKD